MLSTPFYWRILFTQGSSIVVYWCWLNYMCCSLKPHGTGSCYHHWRSRSRLIVQDWDPGVNEQWPCRESSWPWELPDFSGHFSAQMAGHSEPSLRDRRPNGREREKTSAQRSSRTDAGWSPSFWLSSLITACHAGYSEHISSTPLWGSHCPATDHNLCSRPHSCSDHRIHFAFSTSLNSRKRRTCWDLYYSRIRGRRPYAPLGA